MVEYIIGRPALLLPVSQVAAYPGAVETNAPTAAYAAQGAGYTALVLHDPEATTFIPTSTGGLLGQLIYADDWDAAPAAVLDAMPTDGWNDLGFEWQTPDDECVLFDANYAGAALQDPAELAVMADMEVTPIRVVLAKGTYAVHQMTFKPDASTEWTLVRLQRVHRVL